MLKGGDEIWHGQRLVVADWLAPNAQHTPMSIGPNSRGTDKTRDNNRESLVKDGSEDRCGVSPPSLFVPRQTMPIALNFSSTAAAATATAFSGTSMAQPHLPPPLLLSGQKLPFVPTNLEVQGIWF